MNCSRVVLLASLECAALIPGNAARDAELVGSQALPDDPSGVVRLRMLDPSLTGDGITIALVDPMAWVNPATSGQPAEKFFSSSGGGIQLPDSMCNGLVTAAGAGTSIQRAMGACFGTCTIRQGRVSPLRAPSAELSG